MLRSTHLVLIVMLLGAAIPIQGSRAAPIANDPFERTWQRTDKPVADGAVSRTWMWGPEPFTDAKTENYAESPNGARTVQYFDKSRMEITNPTGDQNSPWYVTNGLLVVELMTGRMQVGDNQFEDRAPADINVAGDPDDPLTYAILAGLRGNAALPTGTTITQRVDASGQASDDPSLSHYGVTAVTHVPETNHTVASPFWAFMTASGLVYENGGMTTAPLFQSAYYATGFPITEAYWADVKVGGQQREVLLQCFERRCLTYNPANPDGWQVEAGNVGQHYYRWRYPEAAPGPNAQANQLAAAVTQATNDEDRYQALLAVLSALNVGVYSGQGEMILGGAERGAEDFYLYDIEVQMMAGALGRGQTFGVVDLAMQLTAMELLPEGETFDPELVRQALLRGVAAANSTPNEFTSLSPLIVRQLGLTQPVPYDLFADVPLDEIRLNPLAFFLVLADMTVPLIADQLPVAGASSNLIAQSNGILKPTIRDLQAACDPSSMFNGDAFKNAYGWSKIYAELVGLVPETVGKVTVVLDALHGAILAFSVGVTELDQRLETHYGHESPGQPITFRIKVEMRDDLPDVVIECGWIAGTDFPKQGPIEDVSVHWFWDNLEDHGQINCGNACPAVGGSGVSIDATDASGIARMTFQPKNEEVPGDGWVVEEQGIVTGVALYQSKFTNLLGSYGQYLTPKSGVTRWVVERHEQPGWEVTMEVEYDVDSTWHHIGYDAAADYFEEVADGEGTITLKTFIPASAVNADGPQLVTGEASGSGSVHSVSTDYTKHTAYDLWTWDCTGSYQGTWGSWLKFDDIYSDASGKLTVLADRIQPVTPLTSLWTVDGWHGAGEGFDCRFLIGDSYVSASVLQNVPSFLLDEEGEQHFDGNAADICNGIRNQIISGRSAPDQPGVQQSCSVDAEWTIEVKWAQQPGQ